MSEMNVMDFNKVDGLDISGMLRKLEDSGEAYLDVKWRKLWFRMKYPEGKIDTQIMQLDLEKGIAVVQATIYENKCDPIEQYLARATGQRFRNADEYGDRFVECAETGAVGRALADAGFGTQFCNSEDAGEKPDIVDSPVGINNDSSDKTPPPPPAPDTDVLKPGKPAPSAPVEIPKALPQQPKIMTFADAALVTMESGQYKGKTLSEVAAINPGYIDWIVQKSNLSGKVKEAASILMSAATEKMAS